jgi:DnaJ-class molecular chaperone
MKREEGIVKRCIRCAGSGDVPIIDPFAFVHPDARPLLQCCPDCNGTGYGGDATASSEDSEEPRSVRG